MPSNSNHFTIESMKRTWLFLSLFLMLSLSSCDLVHWWLNGDYQPESAWNQYMEARFSFSDPWTDGYEFGSYTIETWIRKPENLFIAHNTFKKIGYHNLIDTSIHEGYYRPFIHNSIPTEILGDSLLKTFSSESDSVQKYYAEFWARRRAEGNDSAVFQVLTEIYAELYQGQSPEITHELVNDTIYRLAQIHLSEDNLNPVVARENFNYLKNIGLHQSAFNLIRSNDAHRNAKMNFKKLESQLEHYPGDSCCMAGWFEY